MVLKYDSLEKVKEHVQYNNSPVVIYGAGMIGQIIMPYMITSSGMLDNLLFYVDGDRTDYTYWEQGYRDKITRDSGQTSWECSSSYY